MAQDSSAGDTSDPGKECAHCGSAIDVTNWHPLVSRVEDEEVSLFAFCNVDCREGWLDE